MESGSEVSMCLFVCASFFSFVKKIFIQIRYIWNIGHIFSIEVTTILSVYWDIICLQIDAVNQTDVES